jgi:hypothetical protein
VKLWKSVSLLLFIALILVTFERALGPSLVFMSAYGVSHGWEWRHSVALIPTLLAVSFFFPRRFRPWFYFVTVFFLIEQPLLVAPLLVAAFLVYCISGLALSSGLLSIILYFGIGAVIAFSGYWMRSATITWTWLWLMIHVSWGLKLIAWVTSVRVYRYRFSFGHFLDYFFNPVFFFFTNDLNVITPRRFGQSEGQVLLSAAQVKNILIYLFSGLVLITMYGVLQRFYFMQLERWGVLASPLVGGMVSVVTAIIFHGANVLLQVALLRSQGYDLVVDMDRPWLAISPMDYWKRMHFYVREYIFEIIVRPLLATLLRYQQSLRKVRWLIVVLLYLLFTGTQLGYQPFRQSRPWEVGLLVTGIFMAMIIVPEFLLRHPQVNSFFQRKYMGRFLTYVILIVGYSMIFAFRDGF